MYYESIVCRLLYMRAHSGCYYDFEGEEKQLEVGETADHETMRHFCESVPGFEGRVRYRVQGKILSVEPCKSQTVQVNLICSVVCAISLLAVLCDVGAPRL